jgi:hypothetical protein
MQSFARHAFRTCASAAPRLVLAMMLVLFVALLAGSPALAQPAWVPELRPGKRVYTVPADFDPPAIGRAGLERLEQQLLALKYPFHVVVMQSLPDGSGDEDERARFVTDTLLETWAMRGADPATTSVFALTYEPRKFSLLVGARWKTELGLEGTELDPWLDRFLARVRGTPSDPAGGIADMAAALDAFVFDQTDPERIAARRLQDNRALIVALREELRVAFAAPPEYLPWELGPWRLADARLGELAQADDATLREADLQPLETQVRDLSARVAAAKKEALDRQRANEAARDALVVAMIRVEGLLSDPDAPPAKAAFQAAFEEAKKAVLTHDTATMIAALQPFEQATEPLLRHVEEARMARAEREHLFGMALWLLFIALAIAIPLLVRARLRRKKALASFTELADLWDEKLRNAAGRYVEFYGKREGILGLAEMEGKTAALLASVTAEVDAIYTLVNAMQARVGLARQHAADAGFFSAKTFGVASAMIEQPFEFDTGILNETDLFAPPTKMVKIDPATFERDLDARFKASIDGWKRLEHAAELRFEAAATLFPHAALDAMLARCEAEGVPQRWLRDHPLFGDSASDKHLYDGADALKWTDALAFVEQIDALKATETAIAARLEELVASRRRAVAARDSLATLTVPDTLYTTSKLHANEDPRTAEAEADAAWVGFELKLSSPSADGTIDIAPVLAAAETVENQYRRVLERRKAAMEAPDEAVRLREKVVAHAIAAVRVELGVGRALVDELRKNHITTEAERLWAAAEAELGDLDQRFAALGKLVADRWFVRAVAKAHAIMTDIADARAILEQLTAHAKTLRDAYFAWQHGVKGLESRRSAHSSTIRVLGGTPMLNQPPLPADDGPADWVQRHRELEAVFQAWEGEERAARRAAEEAERARRAAAEAARVAAERAAEAARARAVSFSSSRSSSSSSWSSSSSSRSSWSSSSSSSSRSGSWSSSSSSSSRSSSSRSGSW